MAFLKQIVKFLTTTYNLIFTSVLITTYFIMIYVVKIDMTESNSTWVYSSSMQTLAALIALLPISYGYYINNVEEVKSEDYDSYIIDRLKKDVYYEMLTVSTYSLIVIVINLVSFFLKYNIVSSFIIGLLTVEGIGLIALYIYRLYDPDKAKEILKEFDKEGEKVEGAMQISLDTFITTYLELETSVKDYLSNENDSELFDDMPLYDIVDNVSKDVQLLKEHYTTFKEIIFHRNNLVHNYTETSVDYRKYQKMVELKKLFDKYNDDFVKQKIFHNTYDVRKIIEVSLLEYLSDRQNVQSESGVILEDYKEEVASLLHSYFVSQYYETRSLEEAVECDFEIVQNNYSKRPIVGIDIKSLEEKNLRKISSGFFDRLREHFMYLFLINFDPQKGQFMIMYQTKRHELKTIIVS